MWLLGVVLRRYIDLLILLIPTPLVSVLFCSSIPTFLFIFKNVFRSLYIYIAKIRAIEHTQKLASLIIILTLLEQNSSTWFASKDPRFTRGD